MLPALPQAFGNLKDVFRSAINSIDGLSNPMQLPKVKSSLVIMVDGLGWHNLTQYSGHAPFLKKHMSKSSKGYCGFPSTTASSLVSLATSVTPAKHGFIGYRVFDRNRNQSVNLLTGLDVSTVDEYLSERIRTQDESRTVVVSRSEYRDSAFSAATFGSARFIGAADIEERFEIALMELNSPSSQVVYLYVPELDQTAHKFGYQSNKWIERLELIDAQVQKLVRGLASNRGVILTADHGIVDVSRENQIYLDECENLSGVIDVGGDPRSTFLYFDHKDEIARNRAILEEHLAGLASVHTVQDLVDCGLYGTEVNTKANVLPDLVVMAKPGRACYHRSFAKPASMEMIGQHGGITDQEIGIPIIKLGAYSSSLLVP